MEPFSPQESDGIASIEQAQQCLQLGRLIVEHTALWDAAQPEDIPLFNKKQIVGEKNFIISLFRQHPHTPVTKLEEIGKFLEEKDVQDGIKQAHKSLTKGVEKSFARRWFTTLMMYPLMDKLISEPQNAYKDIFSEWKSNIEKGIDPETFHASMNVLFYLLSRWPQKTQEDFLLHTNEQPITQEEADFLAGVFEKVYGETRDSDIIDKADKRNRDFVEQAVNGYVTFTSKDIFHTTDLEVLPDIIDKGLLATECTALTQDGHKEATFAVSFHMFNDPPESLTALGDGMNSGEDTIRKISDKVHLCFLNPQSTVDDDFILYPPDSFWYDRAQRSSKTAGRYISGYDAPSSEFPDKSIAYVLIGMPSPAVTFVMIDEKIKDKYAEKAKSFPFYIPAYSYSGELVYTPQEYTNSRIKT